MVVAERSVQQRAATLAASADAYSKAVVSSGLSTTPEVCATGAAQTLRSCSCLPTATACTTSPQSGVLV